MFPVFLKSWSCQTLVFGHPEKKPTEIWEDNTSCIMMSENPTNRDRSRHVDVKVHYLRDLVRDCQVKRFATA
jgi:hypothetical protein